MEVIQLTEAAQAQAAKLLSEQDGKDGLRVAVVGSGCKGSQYKIGFDALTVEDEVHEYDNGLTVMVDKESATLLEGCSLEFHETSEGVGFEVINPGTSGCRGCDKNPSCQ